MNTSNEFLLDTSFFGWLYKILTPIEWLMTQVMNLFHEFLKQGKRGFMQERRISRKATLKIVDPADDDIESAASHKRDAA